MNNKLERNENFLSTSKSYGKTTNNDRKATRVCGNRANTTICETTVCTHSYQQYSPNIFISFTKLVFRGADSVSKNFRISSCTFIHSHKRRKISAGHHSIVLRVADFVRNRFSNAMIYRCFQLYNNKVQYSSTYAETQNQ